MAFGDKEQPEKIHCIFHEKADCECHTPLTDARKLSDRLAHHIRLNAILIKNTSDQAEIKKLQEKSAAYQARLDRLQNEQPAS